MPRKEVEDDSDRSHLMKYDKHWQKHLSYQNLRHCIPLCSQLPIYLIRRLQRFQDTVAGYTLGRCAKESKFHYNLGLAPSSRNDGVRYCEMYLLCLKQSKMT